MSQQGNDITKNYYAELCASYELPESDIKKISLGEVQSLLYGFRFEEEKLIYEGSEPVEFKGFLLLKVSSPVPADIQISIQRNGEIQELTGGYIQADTSYKTVNASFEWKMNPGDVLEIYSNTESLKVKELKISISKK